MSLPSLQLAAISTAVAGVTQVAIKTAENVGESFADFFVGSATSETGAATNESASGSSVQQQLSELADRFRQWLGAWGIEQPFQLRLQVDELGYSQLDVSGQSGTEVNRLLAEHPDWRQQLERLAAQAQAQTQGLFPSAVEVKLDQAGGQLRRLNSSELASVSDGQL